MQVRSHRKGLVGVSIPVLGLALALAAALPAAAQEDDVATLTEIVVTARKVAENVQDVPGSITVLSGQQLEARGVTSVADLYTVAPNMEFANSGFLFNSLLTIRGVRSSDAFAGFETANGVIVDDVYVGRSAAFNTDLLDIERVEVLRGPQGTLQGKNIIGGAINITTARPGPDFGAGVTLEAGDLNLRAGRAWINAPVSDTVSTRFNVTRRVRDGFTKNATTGSTLGDIDNIGGRAQILFTPSERWSLLLQGEYTRDDATDAGVVFTEPGATTPFSPLALSRTVFSDIDSTVEREVWGLSALLNFEISDSLDFTSVTAGRGYSIAQITEQDGLNVAFVNTSVDQEQAQFSQEFRLTYQSEGTTAVAGVYYFRETLDDTTRLYQDIPFILGIPPTPGFGIVPTDATSVSRVESSSYAAFAAVSHDVTDQLTLAGGLRITRDERENRARAFSLINAGLGYPATLATGQTFTPLSAGTQVPLTVPFAASSFTARELTGDLSLTYEFTPDISVYGKYARGYKGGGYQTGLPTVPAALGAVIRPEFVDNWELGYRSMFLDNRARFNLTGYYMNWTDRQANRVSIIGGIPTYVLYNDPKAVLYGLEAELDVKVTPDLTLGATYGWTHARFEESADPTLDGQEIAGVSPKNFTLSADWKVPLSDQFNLRVNGNGRWGSAYFTSDGGAYKQPSYWWINASVGVETSDGRFALKVWGRNLLDEDVVTQTASGVPGPAAGPFTPGPSRIMVNLREPRTMGVEFSARF